MLVIRPRSITKGKLMKSKRTTHLLFALVSLLCAMLLTSRVFGLELIPSSEPINILVLDKQNCLSILKATTGQGIAAQAGKNYWDCLNYSYRAGFPLDANSGVDTVSNSTSNASPLQQSTTTPRRVNFVLHFTIAISIVILMFRTQIMEWELLGVNRKLDSS